jgi:hypothetical protein
MFLANDKPEHRHTKIRSFLPDEPVIAILLAAVDFEWTIRRAIIALGTNTNRSIRDTVLNRCHGPDDYKNAWKLEVKGRLGKSLADVIPNWEFIKKDAFLLRHQVIHGLKGLPSSKKTSERVDAFLEGSQAVANFAKTNGADLFGKRLPVRRKPRASS